MEIGNSFKKSFLSTLYSLFIYVFSVIIVIISCLYLYIFNCKPIFESMSRSKYYAKAYDQFIQNINDISTPYGIPKNVLTDLVSKDQFTSEVNFYVKDTLNDKNYIPKIDKIETKLENRIKSYYSASGVQLNDLQQKSIILYEKAVCTEYSNSVKIPLLKYSGSVKPLYTKYFIISLVVSAGLTVVLLLLLFKSHYNKHRALRYVSYSMIAAAITTAIIPIYCFATSYTKKAISISEHIRGFVIDYLNSFLMNIFVCSIIFALISFFTIIATVSMRNKAMKS